MKYISLKDASITTYMHLIYKHLDSVTLLYFGGPEVNLHRHMV